MKRQVVGRTSYGPNYTVRVIELLNDREMTSRELVREVPFRNISAFYAWLENQSVSNGVPIYETDGYPRKFGLLK